MGAGKTAVAAEVGRALWNTRALVSQRPGFLWPSWHVPYLLETNSTSQIIPYLKRSQEPSAARTEGISCSSLQSKNIYWALSLIRSGRAAVSPFPERRDSPPAVLRPREGSLQGFPFSVQNPQHRMGSFLFLKYLVSMGPINAERFRGLMTSVQNASHYCDFD